jgi:ERF superfamily
MDTLPNELAASLAKAQTEMSNPAFDSSNPHFRSKFASLAAVRNAVVPALAKHGVFVTQELTRTDKGVACAVILMHSSGSFRYAPFEMPITKDDAQGVASASTYARRYTLQAIACVVGDHDDDGNAAAGKKEVDPRDIKATPQGEDYLLEDEGKVLSYAEKFRAALTVGIDQAVYDLHAEVNPEPAFYIAVSTKLDSKERRAWKEAVARVTAALRAANKNGRGANA